MLWSHSLTHHHCWSFSQTMPDRTVTNNEVQAIRPRPCTRFTLQKTPVIQQSSRISWAQQLLLKWNHIVPAKHLSAIKKSRDQSYWNRLADFSLQLIDQLLCMMLPTLPQKSRSLHFRPDIMIPTNTTHNHPSESYDTKTLRCGIRTHISNRMAVALLCWPSTLFLHKRFTKCDSSLNQWLMNEYPRTLMSLNIRNPEWHH